MTTSFQNDALRFHALDEGDRNAPAVLLVHGFASNIRINWIDPGWVQTLADGGYRVLAFDHRGHGESDKPRDPASYTPQAMARDCVARLDAAGVRRATLFGYSMGARVGAFAALAFADRFPALVFGGLGIGLVDGVGDWDPIAEALMAPDPAAITHERGRMFRAFADRTRSDREALAACIRFSRDELTPEEVGAIRQPTLIGVGTRDDIAGSPEALAALMPDARAFAIANRDHMLAVGDRSFKAAVLDFLASNRTRFEADTVSP